MEKPKEQRPTTSRRVNEHALFPVRKVVLSKTGIGYFEREDEVEGNSSFELYFKSGDMNDVLKSLTMVDVGPKGGLVSSVSYESTKPFDKQLEDLSIILNEESSRFDLLAQVKGTTVEVEVARGSKVEKLTGVIIGLEKQFQEYPSRHPAYLLSLLTEEKGVLFFDLRTIVRLTFTNELLQKDLQHLLNILLLAKKKDLKSVTAFTRGAQERRTIRASYIVEAPVWKTSYRLLLTSKPLVEDSASKDAGKDPAKDAGPKSIFQGWALVDNTQNEDWKNVELSLVSGTANSFIYDLYNPRYVKRTEVEVVQEETHAPPVLEDTVAQHDLSALAEAEASVESREKKSVRRAHALPSAGPPPPPPMADAPPPPPGPSMAPMMNMAMRNMAPRRSSLSFMGKKKDKSSYREEEKEKCKKEMNYGEMEDYDDDGGSASDSEEEEEEEEEGSRLESYSKSDAAQSVEVNVEGKKMVMADMFLYKITNAVTVNRNQSALVPFLQAEFTGSKVAVYNKNVQTNNPLLAIRLKNTFGMPLEGGPLSVFEDDLYVGEAMIGNISPGEEKFVAYSVELKCDVTTHDDQELRDVYRVEIGTTNDTKGEFTFHRYRVYVTTYVIDNKNERPIEELFLEHPRRSAGTLIETQEADERLDHFYRFKLKVPAKGVVKFVVKERETADETYDALDVTTHQADEWFSKGYIDKSVRDTLFKIANCTEKDSKLNDERSLLYRHQTELQQDINRHDDMLGALSNSKSANYANQAKFRDFFTKVQNEAKKEHQSVTSSLGSVDSKIEKNRKKKNNLANGLRYSKDLKTTTPAAVVPQIAVTETGSTSGSSSSGSGSGSEEWKEAKGGKSPRSMFGVLARRLSDKKLNENK